MKRLTKLVLSGLLAIFTTTAFTQKQTPLPHGMVFGLKPSGIEQIPASKLETFMDKRTRITTVVYGKVLRVTKQKGGWFEMDAGNGKIISAHFSDYNIKLPTNLKGREVIIDGIAEKQFIADDLQHLAGDTVQGKKQHEVKTNPKQKLTFEVKGLMVNK